MRRAGADGYNGPWSTRLRRDERLSTWPSRAVAPIGAAIADATLFGLDHSTPLDAPAIAAGWHCDAALPEPTREFSFAQAMLFGPSAAMSAGHGM